MSKQRCYKWFTIEECAGRIARENVIDGKSDGWAGSIEERSAVASRLRDFNIVYVDDIRGEWRVVSHRALPLHGPDDFAAEYHRAADVHAELVVARAGAGPLRLAYTRVLCAELALVIDSRDRGWEQQADALRAELEHELRAASRDQ